MSREVPVPVANEGDVQSLPPADAKALTEPFDSSLSFEVDISLPEDLTVAGGIIDQINQLKATVKVALVRRLMTQLQTEQIQTILECGLREIGDRHRRGIAPTQNTRLLLKKDYSYQDRGLSDPNQYYVYLRRRKPKLDRYIGTLFYVPQGCTLDYFLDAEGRLVFNPPHNVFQLQDCKNPAVKQLVRLLYLEPPPPDYTFDKQQNDTPDIHLHVEYLDLKTHQPIAKQVYPFPLCMHEGGRLDRYRWDVTPLTLKPIAVLHDPSDCTSVVPSTAEKLVASSHTQADPTLSLSSQAVARLSEFQPPPIAARSSQAAIKPPFNRAPTGPPPVRRVLELPATKWLTFALSNSSDTDVILKRMRLWVTWSKKAMPQSPWELIQEGTTHTLMNAHFKRRILRFSSDRSAMAFENSLPVLVRWFHDLSLAVSQSPNQRQYSAAQLQLAHSLFVEMSLPQTDPVAVLKHLFGVDFSKTLPDRR
ncbi:hypothetical protein H6F86_17885 [Phormidium sp. FACHB-592]|uniref:Uncharacterized protein n=1 Tax=Stenomitos frigidus AS-A4 TaxID=2933935 RepID=A0ABV0KIN8_9CYAN|nr:hypothetical protein [Phormidium sp. FACHB-592]MBD2075727.1 hypothetical protein [Phormidium sp. FACHB-592]